MFSHMIRGHPGGLFQFSGGGAVRIILASGSSSMHAMCPDMERCRDSIIAVRSGCLVILLTSSLRTNWCHLIPSSVLKHHWSRASIVRASTLVIAQHSYPYRKILRMQVSYNFNFVGIDMRDFQKWLSRLHSCTSDTAASYDVGNALCWGYLAYRNTYASSFPNRWRQKASGASG